MSGGDHDEDVAANLRRRLRDKDNGRFLQGLAPFRLDPAMPERFAEMLARLDEAERREAR